MFKLESRKKDAHEEAIWCCAWARLKKENVSIDKVEEEIEESETDEEEDLVEPEQAKEKETIDDKQPEANSEGDKEGDKSPSKETHTIDESTKDKSDDDMSKDNSNNDNTDKIETPKDTTSGDTEKEPEKSSETEKSNEDESEKSNDKETEKAMETDEAQNKTVSEIVVDKPKKRKKVMRKKVREISKTSVEYKDVIFTGCLDDTIKIWSVHGFDLKLEDSIKAHSLGVASLTVNKSHTMLASSALDSSLVIWDLSCMKQISKINVGPVDMWNVVFSPDDKYVLSGSQSGKINLYDVETGKLEQIFDTRGKFTLSIAYSSDGHWIASGALDGIINIFDANTGKLAHTLEGHAMPIRDLQFSPDSRYLLTASDDKQMKIYEVQKGDHHEPVFVGSASGHSSWVLSTAFTSDGKYFLSASADHTVRIWEFGKRENIVTFREHLDQVWGVCVSPQGNKIVSVGEDKAIHVYAYQPAEEERVNGNGTVQSDEEMMID
uniref:WD repeat-containing protein 61 n=1 Tax=Cacopsylla melanoneura TaxID=428564 RepID=A0A8D9FGS6_9HEMI